MTEAVDFTEFPTHEEALDAWLEPSLSIKVGINMPSQPPPPPPPVDPSQQTPRIKFGPPLQCYDPVVARPTVHRPTVRARRMNPGSGEETIDPPFPWATDRLAVVHSLDYLITSGVTSIAGEVQCRRCERRETVSYDLRAKFREVEGFVRARLDTMHERAPKEWMDPVFAECAACSQPNCMRPVLPEKEEEYNWLFLFLGQSLGICTLKDLKWFCKHTQNHRTGAKDRVLYLSYMAIGKQLDPAGLFTV